MKCPSPLHAQHYNISIPISKPPFVKFPSNPNGAISGSDIDIVHVIQGKIKFRVRFKKEKRWMDSAESVSENIADHNAEVCMKGRTCPTQ